MHYGMGEDEWEWLFTRKNRLGFVAYLAKKCIASKDGKWVQISSGPSALKPYFTCLSACYHDEHSSLFELKAKLLCFQQDAFSLLAYSDPWNSPVGNQLDPIQREPVCSALNSAILGKWSPKAQQLASLSIWGGVYAVIYVLVKL